MEHHFPSLILSYLILTPTSALIDTKHAPTMPLTPTTDNQLFDNDTAIRNHVASCVAAIAEKCKLKIRNGLE